MPGLVPGIHVLAVSKKAKTWMAGTNPAMTAMLFSYRALQRPRAKRVARFDRALLVAGQEPLLALRRGAVGKGVRHHPARRLALQRVVADRGGGGQCSLDVAGLDKTRAFLFLAIDPDAGQT